jgi:hypothetical protein
MMALGTFFDVVGDYSLVILSATVVLLVIKGFQVWNQQSHVPGPFLASISNIPRLLWARSGAAHLKHINLHQKYGKLVRLGPNSISIGDATEVLQIYGTTGPNFGKVSGSQNYSSAIWQ